MTRDEALRFLDSYVLMAKIATSSMQEGAKDLSAMTIEAIELLLTEVKTNDEKLKIYGIQK